MNRSIRVSTTDSLDNDIEEDYETKNMLVDPHNY